MDVLPVRDLVLYKHGVGFFIRQGTVDANEVTLAFRQDEINDVLKSLTVLDQSGGQVLGIHYQTPMDKADRLANSSINLSDSNSLRDLIRDLRGRRVTLVFEITAGSLETVTGRVIGLDQLNELTESVVSLSVLMDDGQGRVFLLNSLRSFQILDEQSEYDMRYFLDTSMSEDARRTVAVRLSEGSHDLLVSYVAPSPTWRVSYRLVAESEQGKDSGKALLQGWGLFDNRLEEDLENVNVTLVAGQPISFIYDLYASRIPQRPTVQDESRIAPGPIEYEGFAKLNDEIPAQFSSMESTEMMALSSKQRISSDNRALFGLEAIKHRPGMYIGGAAQPAAQGKESGEFFQYVVTTPVSVKRGESALVPIIGAELPYQRELLYNRAKLPDHPVAALRFNNSIDLTLERGPVTVVEDGDYRGEAVVPFTKPGNEVYLPYAVELGVRITERVDYRDETAGLSIEDNYMVFEDYRITSITYVIENTTAKPLTVMIEAPIPSNAKLYDTRPPDVETATDYRWRVNIPAKTRTEFKRQERLLHQRRQLILKHTYQNLRDFLESRWLDKATFDRLEELLQTEYAIQQARAEQTSLQATRMVILERQEQLRATISTLNPQGEEANFRKRILVQLEASQDELEALEKRYKELDQQVADNTEKSARILAELGKEASNR